MNRYSAFEMNGGKIGVYVLLANETQPAKGQLPISEHYSWQDASKAIKRYKAADKRREKQK